MFLSISMKRNNKNRDTPKHLKKLFENLHSHIIWHRRWSGTGRDPPVGCTRGFHNGWRALVFLTSASKFNIEPTMVEFLTSAQKATVCHPM